MLKHELAKNFEILFRQILSNGNFRIETFSAFSFAIARLVRFGIIILIMIDVKD